MDKLPSSTLFSNLKSAVLKHPYSENLCKNAIALLPGAIGTALNILPEKMQDSALLITHSVLPFDLQRRLRANTGSKHEPLKVKMMMCAPDPAAASSKMKKQKIEVLIEGVLSNRGTSDAVFQSYDGGKVPNYEHRGDFESTFPHGDGSISFSSTKGGKKCSFDGNFGGISLKGHCETWCTLRLQDDIQKEESGVVVKATTELVEPNLSVFFFGTWKANKMYNGFLYNTIDFTSYYPSNNLLAEARPKTPRNMRIGEVVDGHIFDHHGNEVFPLGDDWFVLRSSLSLIYSEAIKKRGTINNKNKMFASTTTELDSIRASWIKSQNKIVIDMQQRNINFEKGKKQEEADIPEILHLDNISMSESYSEEIRSSNNDNNKLIFDFLRTDFWWFKVGISS
jgi:hypothetical protein